MVYSTAALTTAIQAVVFSPMSTIGLNAHLFSTEESYRGAGISRYIHQLVQHLPAADPAFSYALFAQAQVISHPRVLYYPTRFSTERPGIRIFWEQWIQPWMIQRAGCAGFHGMAYALPLISDVPATVTIYDLSFIRLPEHFRAYNRLYLRLATSLAVRRAHTICVISQHTQQDLQQHFGVDAERVVVIYPGCAERFCPQREPLVEQFRQRQGLPDHFVLYVGTLEPRKNLKILLQAYARLDGPHHLVLAGGKGWYYEEVFAEVERLGLLGRVHFPGYIPEDEKPLWYAAAEVFVYPSQYEGFGMPPLEAMACGTPVVTSNVSSLPEVVGSAGFTVAPDDVDALASSLARLLHDSELRALFRERGLAQAQRFTWSQSAQTQVQVYHALLLSSGEGRA